MSELAQQFDLHPNQIKQWKDRLLENVSGVFEGGAQTEPSPPVDVKELHAKFGQLALEDDFLSGALDKVGLLLVARQAMRASPRGSAKR